MLKPTSVLNFKILEFVMSNDKVQHELEVRDRHKDAQSRELRVTLERQLENPKQSGYRVDFIYITRDPKLNSTDDISVYVEVTEGIVPAFKIIRILSN